MATELMERKKLIKFVKKAPDCKCPSCKEKLRIENKNYFCDTCNIQVIYRIKEKSIDE